MDTIVSTVLVVVGEVLNILGVEATNSFRSDVSRFLTGSHRDKAVWMLFGGPAGTLRVSRPGWISGRLKACLTPLAL